MSFLRVPGADLWRAGGGCHAAWREGRAWSLADALEEHFDRRAAADSGRVVANSRMAAAELVERYGIAADRACVVHNGVDLLRFRPGAERDVGRVVFLGSGFARKGLETALEAVRLLPAVRLEVIGGDPRLDRWKARVGRSDLEGRVRFLGPRPDPEALLPGAGALLLPTRYDPFANVVLEAMAAGVPPITSGRNGAVEVLPEPWMAVADPRDARGFAAALERALRDPSLPARCRRAGEAHSNEASFAALSTLLLEPPDADTPA